ncbi:uncharacterized protein LOC123294994 isoform X2 [Chrysoperla carnea]|uniref:uncharacterized protein LOC123294994 isoform X2 n=1 Tax=Chrysoperla carnea TaxID=189513 RepID=UPI001D076722|nr:uncharacterized protein LOC123294994 isoform X2 [Chrysoperla carnea]
MRWFGILIAAILLVAIASVEGEVWEEDDHEILIRSERGTKNREACKYTKGAWSECDLSTNMRSRTLTLKKGDPQLCDKSKTIQKKCKKGSKHDKKSKPISNKFGNASNVTNANAGVTQSTSRSTSLPAACRYERGSWSECNGQSEITRIDKLKPNSDSSCEQSRQITKKCKTKKGGKPPKSANKASKGDVVIDHNMYNYDMNQQI